jgi:4-amino-4-deoxy-L-arabinose transferase-like glycosyltransferase
VTNQTSEAPTALAARRTAVRRAPLLGQRVVPSVVSLALLLWMVVVAILGAGLALRAFGLPVGGEAQRSHATPQAIVAALLIVTVCVGTALLTRAFQPSSTLVATFAVAGVVLFAGAVGTGAVGSLLLVVALFALAWLLGGALLPRQPLPAAMPLVRLPIAIALGSGMIGLYLLGLAMFGALNTATVVGGAAALLVLVLLLERQQVGDDLQRLCSWQPAPPTVLETVVVSIALGLVAYASLAAFVPEVHSDAVRHHVPIAREIWQTGAAPEFPPMWTSRSPIHAHMLYAAAYGFGGIPAAKLVHTLTGLVALLGIAGIGWLVMPSSGMKRIAAVTGAAVFAAMPLVLWELGMALVDLFPVMFAVTAALCVLLWQRDGPIEWLAVAGALAGFGFAAKMTMGLMIVALGLAILLVGRGPWQWRDRLLAGVAFGLGTLLMLPWIARSYAITGTIPGLSLLAASASGSAPVSTSDLPDFGIGRSPLALLRIPWELTFAGDRFHQAGGGDVGILLLMTLPLALFAPRTRATAFLALTAALSYLGWVFTAQLTRYLLPTLAIAAALAGIGVASAVAATPAFPLRHLTWAAPTGVVLGLIAAPLLFLPSPKFRLLPMIDVVAGDIAASAFVDATIPAAAALRAASVMLPPDTPVGYIGKWEVAQLYTEARQRYFGDDTLGTTPESVLHNLDQLGDTPEAVLASLERLGIAYVIWSREDTPPQAWDSTLLSSAFLRDHTRVLAADRGGYLLEIVPNGGNWGVVPDRNLLQDQGLDDVGDDGVWSTAGETRVRRGVVVLRARGAITQEAPVSAGSPYLLVTSVECSEPDQRAQLTLTWLDAHQATLETSPETVIPGTKKSTQFLWHIAPRRATSVAVELSAATGANCEFDEAALYASS